uniref:Uncharacterized protein n=1 Tax=Anguilla anguilla TaxID=7936 RepID=A0A0E9U3X2_ANGAN
MVPPDQGRFLDSCITLSNSLAFSVTETRVLTPACLVLCITSSKSSSNS